MLLFQFLPLIHKFGCHIFACVARKHADVDGSLISVLLFSSTMGMADKTPAQGLSYAQAFKGFA